MDNNNPAHHHPNGDVNGSMNGASPDGPGPQGVEASFNRNDAMTEDAMAAVRRLLFGEQVREIQSLISDSKRALSENLEGLRATAEKRFDDSNQHFSSELGELRGFMQREFSDVRSEISRHQGWLEALEKRIISLENSTTQRFQTLSQAAANSVAKIQGAVNASMDEARQILLAAGEPAPAQPAPQPAPQSQSAQHQGY